MHAGDKGLAILSIQSHVAYGYVGNRAAVFPLERLGYNVLPINTVQFSNHTGYESWKGDVFSADHIKRVASGIEAVGALANTQALLSGYLGEAAVGEAVLSILKAVQTKNPLAIYHCDPVMGDVATGVYVAPEIIPFMRDKVVPQANILTPNHFEFELLLSRPVRSFKEAHAICSQTDYLKEKLVCIKSFRPDELAKNQLSTYLYTPEGSYAITTPYWDFPNPPSGTGDLFSALFLGHYLSTKKPVEALEKAVSAVFAVLEATHQAGDYELRLVSSQEALVAKAPLFKAKALS